MKNHNIFKYNISQIIYNKFNGKGPFCLISSLLSKTEKHRVFRDSSLIPITMSKINMVDQATHPDILISDFQGSNKYYLTVSGYPYNIARYEDQYLLTSNDGIRFKNILGDKPIAVYGGNGISHYSDGDIIINDNELLLYYRMCYEDCEKPYITIFMTKTSNLKDWTTPEEIVSSYGITFISPAIVNDKCFKMFFVNQYDDDNKLFMRKSSNHCFSNYVDQEVNVNNLPQNGRLWHLDVIADGNRYYGLFVISYGKGGHNARLFEALSIDEGLTWNIGKEIVLDVNYDLIKRVYRSSMVKNDKGMWDLYIPIRTKKDCWFISLFKDYVFSFDK